MRKQLINKQKAGKEPEPIKTKNKGLTKARQGKLNMNTNATHNTNTIT